MAASGLKDRDQTSDLSHVAAIADYAFRVRKQLENINENSWNSFKLRIGTQNQGWIL